MNEATAVSKLRRPLGLPPEQSQMGNAIGRLRALSKAISVACCAAVRPFARPDGRRFQSIATFAAVLAVATGLLSSAGASQYARLDYNLFIGSRFRHTAFIELFDDRPVTKANFLQYVNQGKYTASMMHRWVPGTLLQGGGYYPQFVTDTDLTPAAYLNSAARVDLDGNPLTPDPTIQNEFTNSPTRLNARGTLSMMQLPASPNSASSQWFINLKNNPSFDVASEGSGPYTVFGRLLGDGIFYVDDMLDPGLTAIFNMNPDFNNDGQRDIGVFDAMPLFANTQLHALQIVNAEQIDYYGAGPATAAPANGLITVAGRSAVIDTGATFTGLNQFVVSQGRTLQIREDYSLAGDITNSGVLDPGLQIGRVQVSNYFQNFDGTLKIEIAGNEPDTTYDRLVATSGAFLSGKLDVDFTNGYTPAVGASFTVLNSNSITGLFTSFDLPQLTAGLAWRVGRTGTAYTLAVAGGDYNRNGIVDHADYVVWRNSRGTSVQVGTLVGNGADGDRNGVIDDNDYLIWRANIGNLRGITSSGGSGTAVPEPSGLAVLGSALFLNLHWRRRRV